MAYERLNLKDGNILDQTHIKRIDDAIEALDVALDAKATPIQKVRKSTNLWDKTKYNFINDFYFNIATTNKKLPSNSGTYGGGGWRNIPVEAGKSYVLCVNNPVTLTDMDNTIYGVFTNIFFTDSDNVIITNAPYKRTNYFTKAYTGSTLDSTALAEIAYNTNKVRVYNYDGSSSYKMGTNCVVVEVKDENIKRMHIQIGSTSFGDYQISDGFNARGHLTEAEIAQIVDSFQINEGEKLLPYEEFYEEVYTTVETVSNLTKLQSAFVEKPRDPTNILKPSYGVNHKYINAVQEMTKNANGNYTIKTATTPKSALISIPVSKGSYIISSNSPQTIGNMKFMYFGAVMFMDSLNGIVTYSYESNTKYYFNKHKDFLPDITKAKATGYGTQTLKIDVYDESITSIYIVVMDSTISTQGIWTDFDQADGLTNEQLSNLIYYSQMNVGKELLKWEAWDSANSVQAYVKTEYIEGLDEFKDEITKTIKEINAKPSSVNMVAAINGNKIYVRSKRYTESTDFVWDLEKVNSEGSNKYFNINRACTCPHASLDDEIPAMTRWKNCSDDIFPTNFYGTYIGANHGYLGANSIKATAHGKTEADIGSIWISKNTTFCLYKVPDENTLLFMPFNDACMASGNMIDTLASGTLTHSSGATNTGDIVIESATTTQLWQSYNKYSIKLLVDGVEKNIDEDGFYYGDRVEIVTQYNIFFVPAMITYLQNNVGNNTNDSHNSDDIEEFYMTVYINYQFNMNGSVSTYSSYYIGKDISSCQLGLVQSMAIAIPAYCYIPDTTYDEITVMDTDDTTALYFSPSVWNDSNKAPYRYYQFTSDSCGKGICLVYDRSIGYGENGKRIPMIRDRAGYFNGSTKKMYPQMIQGQTLTTGTLIDGMAARVPLYKYDEDITSVGWYWCSDDIILMIDAHQTVNKDIVLPDYMNNHRIEILDKTDSCNVGQTYIFNNKLRFQCTDYGYAVLRLYK